MPEYHNLAGTSLDLALDAGHDQRSGEHDHEDIVADVVVKLRRRDECGRNGVAHHRGAGEVVGLDQEVEPIAEHLNAAMAAQNPRDGRAAGGGGGVD